MGDPRGTGEPEGAAVVEKARQRAKTHENTAFFWELAGAEAGRERRSGFQLLL